jgi:hypothetical protein
MFFSITTIRIILKILKNYVSPAYFPRVEEEMDESNER